MKRRHPPQRLRCFRTAACRALGAVLVLAGPLAGQGSISVALPGGGSSTVDVESHRGYPAVPASALEPLTWSLAEETARGMVVLEHRTGLTLGFIPGSPLLSWDGRLVQTVHSPYWFGETFYLPIQVVTDLFPGMLPDAYRYDEATGRLEVEGAVASAAPAAPPGSFDRPAPADDAASANAAAAQPTAADPPASAAPAQADDPSRAPRIVVIDPGHGGDDPGALGAGGVREKDVALAVALALRRELAGDPEIEVRLTRDRDVLVPLWERGELATAWKGDRPGVFVSIHANALPDRTGVRGFETYFLSEARTEHERRVAAAENAAATRGREGATTGSDPLLAQILTDLRTFDHQHWSALLAEEVQRELGSFHPGPDRGVKQGPLAVITNSLMPSVLVEVGFLTNPQEARALTLPGFHDDAAAAIARAIERFFQRYPPGEMP